MMSDELFKENLNTGKIMLDIKKKTLPIFDQFIWRDIIQKYLLPIDILRLSATSWKFRKLISNQLNLFWYYLYLLKTDKIKISGYRHYPEPMVVNCLSSDLLRKYGVGQSDVVSLKEHPDIIKTEKISDLINGRNLIIPSTLCIKNCLGKNHWTPYNISFDQWCKMEKDHYHEKTNYFFEYLDLTYNKQKHHCRETVNRYETQLKRAEIELVEYTNSIASMERTLSEMKRMLPERQKNCHQRIKSLKDKIDIYQPVMERLSLESYQGPVNGLIFFNEEMRRMNPDKKFYHGELRHAWKNLTQEDRQFYRDQVKKMREDRIDKQHKWVANRI